MHALASVFALALVLVSCGGRSELEPTAPDAGAPVTVDDELFARWNAAFDTTPGVSLDFRWSRADDFPHPTYRGGSGASYTQFAQVLTRFLRSGDNHTFLTQHELFDRVFLTGPPSGRRQLTLRSLIRDLKVHPLVEPGVRAELSSLCGTAGC